MVFGKRKRAMNLSDRSIEMLRTLVDNRLKESQRERNGRAFLDAYVLKLCQTELQREMMARENLRFQDRARSFCRRLKHPSVMFGSV